MNTHDTEATKASPRIAVLGSLYMDWVMQVPQLPAPGGVAQANRLQQVPGGKGLRLALACTRQGAAVQMFGSVGRDSAGHMLRMALQQAGVDVAHVQVQDGMATGASLQLCEGQEAPRTVLLPCANTKVELPMHSFVAALTGSEYLLVSSELPQALAERAVQMAHAAGCRVALQASVHMDIPAHWWPQLQLLVIDAEQAGQYTGLAVQDADSALRAARLLLAQGVPQVVLSWCGQGALALDASGYSIHPCLFGPLADSPAVADAFMGALLARMAEGSDLGSAVSWGLAAASLTQPWGAMPQFHEVQALLGPSQMYA